MRQHTIRLTIITICGYWKIDLIFRQAVSGLRDGSKNPLSTPLDRVGLSGFFKREGGATIFNHLTGNDKLFDALIRRQHIHHVEHQLF